MTDTTGNPFRDKGSRSALDTQPSDKGETKAYSQYDIDSNGSLRFKGQHPKNPHSMEHHPSGAFEYTGKDGSRSTRIMGEWKIESHSVSMGVSENVDLATGGHLTVKTVGGLEAQISGEGNITIAGATAINIMDNAIIAVKGNATISAEGAASIDAKGINLSSSAGIAIGAAGAISLQAGGGIKMQEGGAKVSGYMGGGNES